MIWDGLTVVGADAPDDGGLAISYPFLADGAGTVFRVSDIYGSDPTATESSIPPADFEGGVQGRAWLLTPQWPAQPGYMTIVQGAKFAAVLDAAAQRDTIQWAILDAGYRGAYMHHDAVHAWQKECAEHLIEWGRLQLRDAMAHRRVNLEIVDAAMQRAVFVTDEGSEARMAVYATLAVVLGRLDGTALPVLEEIVQDEFSEPPSVFAERVARLVAELQSVRQSHASSFDEQAAMPSIFGAGLTTSFDPVTVMAEIDGIAA